MNIAAVSGTMDFATFRKLKKTHNVGGILVAKGNHGKTSSVPSEVLKILDPAKKKLTSVEGQRIMAVILEGIKRVQIVSLYKYAMENMERFSVSFGTELASCLETHNQLVKKYVDLWTELKEITGSDFFSLGIPKTDRRTSSVTSRSDRGEDSNEVLALNDKEKFKSHYNYLQSLETQIHHSCRILMRHFSNNPTAIDVLNSENPANDNRQKETGDLIDAMVELKAILLSKLLTTPNEEKVKDQHLTHVTQSERKAAEVIKMLEVELNAATEDRDQEVS